MIMFLMTHNNLYKICTHFRRREEEVWIRRTLTCTVLGYCSVLKCQRKLTPYNKLIGG